MKGEDSAKKFSLVCLQSYTQPNRAAPLPFAESTNRQRSSIQVYDVILQALS